MRRAWVVDGMLLGSLLLWALNIVVTKYMFEHGWEPLAYGIVRYFAAIVLFWIFTFARERSFRFERRDLPRVGIAAAMIFVNQLCFVYALKLAQASTVSLIFGTTPIFVALIAVALGIEDLRATFWTAAGITFAGVALIALAGSGVSADLEGSVLAIGIALTWGCYTLAVAPLIGRYSPYRVSSVVLLVGWVPLAVAGAPQISDQQWSFRPVVWAGLAFAIVGPLFLTTILWFRAVSLVGASRAALFNNLQPFFAVVFALILLGESLHPLEVVGGVLIFAGIAVERIWGRVAVVTPPAE